MVKKISDEQKKIKLATHGEDYRSWMSNPVFYVYGGLTLVLAMVAVLCFKLLATPVRCTFYPSCIDLAGGKSDRA